MKNAIISLCAILVSLSVTAQTRISAGRATLDRTVHDFGDICLSDGPVSCTFHLTNTGSTPLTILSVVSSCGCTNVQWTRGAIAPGAVGIIEATYRNDEGAVPFDKALTAYLSDITQPVILRLRGAVHEKVLPLGELYPVRMGDFAMKEGDIPRLSLSQGQQKSAEILVANVGDRPLEVSFRNVSDGLKIKVSPNPIPSESTAKLSYTIKSDRGRWGLNRYEATPVIGGRSYAPLRFTAATKEDFSGLSKEQRAAGANPKFAESVISFNPVKAGARVNASFKVSNIGGSVLHVYKVDADSEALEKGVFPDIEAGGNGTFNCSLDTASLPEGEVRVMITLTTNSPLRPIVNLFITGFVK